MKPVAIFRFSPTEGPGHLADFLAARGIAWQLIAIDEGAAVPAAAGEFSGLVCMGGAMSVNDDLPWIPPLLALIRQAVRADIPLLGHCLGGQLMSKALGAAVTRNPVREIGWGRVAVADFPLARAWFGDLAAFDAFHWHGETFALPDGATRVLSSAACANQAWVLGPHLAMQCHVEMTAPMVRKWCAIGSEEIAAHPAPTVQSAAEMQRDLAARAAALNRVAELLYTRWSAGLAPSAGG